MVVTELATKAHENVRRKWNTRAKVYPNGHWRWQFEYLPIGRRLYNANGLWRFSSSGAVAVEVVETTVRTVAAAAAAARHVDRIRAKDVSGECVLRGRAAVVIRVRVVVVVSCVSCVRHRASACVLLRLRTPRRRLPRWWDHNKMLRINNVTENNVTCGKNKLSALHGFNRGRHTTARFKITETIRGWCRIGSPRYVGTWHEQNNTFLFFAFLSFFGFDF